MPCVKKLSLSLACFFVFSSFATSRFLKSIFSTTQPTKQNDKSDFFDILQDSVSSKKSSTLTDTLVARTEHFVKKYPSIKLQKTNTLDYFIKNQSKTDVDQIQKDICFFAQTATIFLSVQVKKLIRNFIEFKKIHGNQKEKLYYKSMDENEFIKKLMLKKYFVYARLGGGLYVHNGKKLSVYSSGLDENEFDIHNSLTLDEVKIGAFIGAISGTHFINDGSRTNNARFEKPQDHLGKGWVAAQVGACFEKENILEWQEVFITKNQNTVENGYGKQNKNGGTAHDYKKLWQEFYELKEPLPTFGEVKQFCKTMPEPKTIEEVHYIKLDAKGTIYFNLEVYKKRMEAVLIPFLKMADELGIHHEKEVCLYATGLGLGVWAQVPASYSTLQNIETLPKVIRDEFRSYFKIEQNQVIDVLKYLCSYVQIKIYESYFAKHQDSRIKKVYLSWFMNNHHNKDTMLQTIDTKPTHYKNDVSKKVTRWNKTEVFWTTLPPASPFFENETMLNVSNFAWDGATQVGNEYWIEALTASADPAAAAACHITTYQNPHINEKLVENIVFFTTSD